MSFLYFSLFSFDSLIPFACFPSIHHFMNFIHFIHCFMDFILFHPIPSHFTAAFEVGLIHRAMAEVMNGLKQCVTFREVLVSSPHFKIKLSPLQAGKKTPETLCQSYPGFAESLAQNGAKEQPVSVARGSHGCLPADGKLRGVMKVLLNLLGHRNEHQRSDRDQYIALNASNVLLAVSSNLASIFLPSNPSRYNVKLME